LNLIADSRSISVLFLLTSKPPGQPADISVRTILQLFLSSAIWDSCGGVNISSVICTLALAMTNSNISSDPVFFLHSEGF
jgi:hypothetical protein